MQGREVYCRGNAGKEGREVIGAVKKFREKYREVTCAEKKFRDRVQRSYQCSA